MRFALVLFLTVFASNISAQTAPEKLWSDLKAKRESLSGLHQEFNFTRTTRTSSATQTHSWNVVIDMSSDKWRDRFVSGAGDQINFFDGQDRFRIEEGGDEYVRIRRNPKDLQNPQPGPYSYPELDWRKAKEVARQPCGLSGNDHTCIVLRVPLKPWVRLDGQKITRMSDGMLVVSLDGNTGALVDSDVQEAIDAPRVSYVSERRFSLKNMTYNAALDAGLFKVPETGFHEVKQLTRWNAERIREQLGGKPAPDLQLIDLQGKTISLGDLKGKTVLLDFWASWCPPCVSDGPALDKLYQKYGGQQLMIIGVSVEEERDIVENFLKKHPHAFPVVLSKENDMPRPYEIGVFPTYVVISPDGTVATAVQGDQGFGDLRKFLQKAGMDTP